MSLVQEINRMLEMAKFDGLCLPSKIYFVIAVVSIVLSVAPLLLMLFKTKQLFSGTSLDILFRILSAVIFIIFWTFILQLLCTNGFETLSWVIVIFRYVIISMLILFILLTKNKSMLKVQKVNKKDLNKFMNEVKSNKKRRKRGKK